MKLNKMLELVRSTWIKQDNGLDGRMTIELITCPIVDYVKTPEDHMGDLLCAYVSDYWPDSFLSGMILNKKVLGIAARNTDHIVIEIED